MQKNIRATPPMGGTRVRRNDTRAIQNTARIAGAAAKVGLYIATAAMSCKAILIAAEKAWARPFIAGGEIFTIPLILALLLVGWAVRGDVERARRMYRRQAHGRQKHERQQ